MTLWTLCCRSRHAWLRRAELDARLIMSPDSGMYFGAWAQRGGGGWLLWGGGGALAAARGRGNRFLPAAARCVSFREGEQRSLPHHATRHAPLQVARSEAGAALLCRKSVRDALVAMAHAADDDHTLQVAQD